MHVSESSNKVVDFDPAQRAGGLGEPRTSTQRWGMSALGGQNSSLEASLDNAYQSSADFIDTIVGSAEYDLAKVVLGELAVKERIAQDNTNELVVLEGLVADAIAQNAEKFRRPRIRFVPNGDMENPTAKTMLPDGVDGAFVPGKGNRPGTILISESLEFDPEKLEDIVLEEFGEALGHFLETHGFEPAEGDIGNRIMQLVNRTPIEEISFEVNAGGLDPDADPDKAKDYDEQYIMFRGERTAAKTATDGTAEELLTLDGDAATLEVLPETGESEAAPIPESGESEETPVPETATVSMAVAGDETKTDEQLAAEWGTDVADVRWSREVAADISPGTWIATSFPQINDWGFVIEAYGTDGELSEIQMANAIADDAVITREIDGIEWGYAVDSVDRAAIPEPDPAVDEFEGYALEWGVSAEDAAFGMTAAVEILEARGVEFVFADDADAAWARFVNIYGNGNKVGVFGIARGIADGALGVKDTTGHFTMNGTDLTKVSNSAITDAIWAYAEKTFGDGAERTQITLDMLNEAVAVVLGNENSFVEGDYGDVQQAFADVHMEGEEPIHPYLVIGEGQDDVATIGAPTRFSKEAILAMWDTHGFARRTVDGGLDDGSGTVELEPVTDIIKFGVSVSDYHHGGFWSTALGYAESGVNEVVSVLADIADMKVQDVIDTLRGVLDYGEALAAGAFQMVEAFGLELLAEGEAALGALEEIVGALLDIPGLSEEGQAFINDANEKAKAGNDKAALGTIMVLAGLNKEEAQGIIDKMAVTANLVTNLMDGDNHPDMFDGLMDELPSLMSEAINGGGLDGLDDAIVDDDGVVANSLNNVYGTNSLMSDDGYNLNDDKLAEWLGGFGPTPNVGEKSRFDWSVDMASWTEPLGEDATYGTMDHAQFRMMFTHPTKISDTEYSSQIRFRVLDVVGEQAGSFDGGLLGVHDIIIPVTFDQNMANAEYGEVLWSATTGFEAEVTATQSLTAWYDRKVEEFETRFADNPYMDWMSGNFGGEAETLQINPVIEGLAKAGKWLGDKGFDPATQETGIGAGFNFAYNLNQLEEHSSGFGATVPFLAEAFGAGVGAAGLVGLADFMGWGEVATAENPDFQSLMAHAGADLGALAADGIYSAFANANGDEGTAPDDVVNASFSYFAWTGERPIATHWTENTTLKTRWQLNMGNELEVGA